MTETNDSDLARLGELLGHIAHRPTTADLWALHGALLACTDDPSDAGLASEIARGFYLYLSELQGKMTARQYNELASRLDIGAVGTLALQDILLEHENLWSNLLLGGVGEGLMLLASRQYIKAWEQELKLVQRRTAWDLYSILWKLSRQFQPEMETGKRQALIETTLASALDEDTPFETRMLTLLRLFQVALLLVVAPLCVSQPSSTIDAR